MYGFLDLELQTIWNTPDDIFEKYIICYFLVGVSVENMTDHSSFLPIKKLKVLGVFSYLFLKLDVNFVNSKCLARSFIVNNYLYFLFITFLRHTYTMNIAWHWLQILSASVFEHILIRKRIWKTAALIIFNERFKIPYICMFFLSQ